MSLLAEAPWPVARADFRGSSESEANCVVVGEGSFLSPTADSARCTAAAEGTDCVVVGVWDGVLCGLCSVLFFLDRDTLAVLYFAGGCDGRMGEVSRDGRGDTDKL